jgi:hypothetical protein
MPEYKYMLTRQCLRTGQLSLPYRMLEHLANREGETADKPAWDVQVMDTEANEVFTARFAAPRTLAGLAAFFERHQLAVNDTLIFEVQDPGTLLVTPQGRGRRAAPTRGDSVSARALDSLHAAGTPLSEAEMRAVQPALSRDAELSKRLISDPRFTLREGRWQPAQEAQGATPSASERALEAERAASPDMAAPAPESPTVADVLEEKPRPRWGRSPRSQPRPRASVTPYPRGVIFPGDAGLNSEGGDPDISQQQRLKDLLTDLGYRVEGLAHGNLLAHADLTRRSHSVLVHLLPEHGQLDWAALLARRREVGATYAAVFGHDLDLASHEGPAEMGRASLWSWAGLERLKQLAPTVPMCPVDLEEHFARAGLYGKGLARFEQTVEARVAERGVFSAVLTRLAAMRAPAVFLLDDVADPTVSREQVLKVLELLSQAPFHLVSKVDSGEFCLRLRVGDGLGKFADYTASLRERLPSRRTERLHGEPIAIHREG